MKQTLYKLSHFIVPNKKEIIIEINFKEKESLKRTLYLAGIENYICYNFHNFPIFIITFTKLKQLIRIIPIINDTLRKYNDGKDFYIIDKKCYELFE